MSLRVAPGRRRAFDERAQPAAGAAEHARDGDNIADLRRAATQEQRCAVRIDRGVAVERDRDGDDGRGDDVAAGDRDAVRLRALAEPGVQRVDRVDGRGGRQAERDERERRRAAHRRDVADVHGERLPADVAPRDGVRQEVYAGDHRIGGGDRVCAAIAPDRRIVADADDQALGRRPRQRRAQAFDQAEFAEIADVHTRQVTGCVRRPREPLC